MTVAARRRLPSWMVWQLLGAALIGLACGARLKPSMYPTSGGLFDASLAAFREGDCNSAEIGFGQLLLELPARDPRRAESNFYLGECGVKRRRYLEATRNYRRVADEFAQDSLAPLALLRTGDAYSRLWRRAELDPTYGVSAQSAYRELLTRYPDTDAATRARARIAALNEKFARKAYRTGIYYLRFKAYDSAIIYFKGVVADFPETSYATEALLKLVEAYEQIGYEEDMRDMCLQLQRFYPDALSRAEACLTDTTSA